MKGFSNRRTRPATSVSRLPGEIPLAEAGNAATRAILLLLTVALVVVVVVWGISSRRNANAQLSEETQELAIPTMSVIHPKLGAPQQEIVLPGDMQPFTDAPIYARTNGYLKSWAVDIGAHVKTGQLLAEIDAPEVDQQLQQARADLATAQANLHLAEITATRYKDLLKTERTAADSHDSSSALGTEIPIPRTARHKTVAW